MWKGFTEARSWLISFICAALAYSYLPGNWYVLIGALALPLPSGSFRRMKHDSDEHFYCNLIGGANDLLRPDTGYVLLKNKTLNNRQRKILEVIPGCVLISMITPYFYEMIRLI